MIKTGQIWGLFSDDRPCFLVRQEDPEICLWEIMDFTREDKYAQSPGEFEENVLISEPEEWV